jgi:hypothetical protein
MAQIWLATMPNNRDHPDKTFATIQSAVTASSYAKMSRVEVPSLTVGTLDTLMSLADDLTKIGMAVEVRCLLYCLLKLNMNSWFVWRDL